MTNQRDAQTEFFVRVSRRVTNQRDAQTGVFCVHQPSAVPFSGGVVVVVFPRCDNDDDRHEKTMATMTVLHPQPSQTHSIPNRKLPIAMGN